MISSNIKDIKKFDNLSLKNDSIMDNSEYNKNDDLRNGLEKISLSKDENQRKRTDNLTWEDYFMSTAVLSAKRSKDPKTQVGACIVNENHQIVGIGYNGMPAGCSDDELPWGKDNKDPMENKHLYVCHAEMNAILNNNSSNVSGCTIFVTLFPCNECAKMIVQSRICQVIYMEDKHNGKIEYKAAKKIFDMAGVKYRKFTAVVDSVEISLRPRA